MTAPYIVDWYRLDRAPQVTATLRMASLVLLLGALLTAFVLARFGAQGFQGWFARVAAAVGALLVVAGPWVAILGLRRVWLDESYVLLRTDGIVLRQGERESFVAWDETEDFSEVAEGVCIHLRDGSRRVITERFAGTTPAQLPKRMAEVRRKALWNAL